MEFVLIAYAILIGMGVAEILRGFADLIRAESVELDGRLLLFAFWVLFVILQVFWAMWRIQRQVAWTFPEFLLFLLPAVLLYVIARISFPLAMDGADLGVYYERATPGLWGLTAAFFLSAASVQPLLYSSVQAPLLASQLSLAILALAAIKVRSPSFHLSVLVAMTVQVAWRGFVVVVT